MPSPIKQVSVLPTLLEIPIPRTPATTNATDNKIKLVHQHLAHTGAAGIIFGMLANNGDPVTCAMVTLFQAGSTFMHAPCNNKRQMIGRFCHTTLAGMVNYMGSQYANSPSVIEYGPDAQKFVQSFTNLVSGSLLHGLANFDKDSGNSTNNNSETTPLLDISSP